MLTQLKSYYLSMGIYPTKFTCASEQECKKGAPSFTGPTCTHVGTQYERGFRPRLVFLSLDSGEGASDPERRSFEAIRRENESWDVRAECVGVKKARHWCRLLELATTFLSRFDRNIKIETVTPFFCHVNSAKCCWNNRGKSQAPSKLFKNCRGYLKREMEILSPDIIISQGRNACAALEFHFNEQSTVRWEGPRIGTTMLLGKKVLWIVTYHPGYFARFNQERKDWGRFADEAEKFMGGDRRTSI